MKGSMEMVKQERDWKACHQSAKYWGTIENMMRDAYYLARIFYQYCVEKDTVIVCLLSSWQSPHLHRQSQI